MPPSPRAARGSGGVWELARRPMAWSRTLTCAVAFKQASLDRSELYVSYSAQTDACKLCPRLPTSGLFLCVSIISVLALISAAGTPGCRPDGCAGFRRRLANPSPEQPAGGGDRAQQEKRQAARAKGVQRRDKRSARPVSTPSFYPTVICQGLTFAGAGSPSVFADLAPQEVRC